MKTYATQPYAWTTGELLDPARANANLQAVLDADVEAAARRYSRSAVVLRFQTDAATPYTQALSQENRSFRLSFPKTVVLERAYFAYADTGVGTVISVNLTDVATGLAPSGITNPWLTVNGATGALVEVTDLDTTQVTLTAGAHYKVELTAVGAFSTAKAELVLHLLADRFQNTSGVDGYTEPTPIFLTQASDLSAATWNAHANSGITPVTANLAAALVPGYKPTFFHLAGLTSGMGANLRRWDIPRSSSSLRKQTLSGVVIYAALASNGAAAQTVTWTLQDEAGATVQAFSVSVAGVTFATATTSGLAIVLASGTAGIKTDTTKDYRLVASTNGATTILKTYCYLLWE